MVLRDVWRGLLALAVIHIAFFWKILLTDQFSFLIQWDNANQIFPWTQFVVRSLAEWNLPLWDPHAFAGRSFVGEMQTGLFNPLNVPLYAAGWIAGGVIQPRWIDFHVVGCHLLACWFLYLFALRLRLSRRAALVAGCVFGLGGFVGNVPWPGMLSSSVWLPLIAWAALDALESSAIARRVMSASLAGLGVGLAALAGGMQIVFIDLLLVTALCLYWPMRQRTRDEPRGKPLLSGAACALVIGVTALIAGAAQLLPSIEYGRDSLRWVGAAEPLPSLEKIPYHLLSSEAALPPRGLLNLLFGGAPVGTSEIPPYIGILPLILAVIAVRRRWNDPLVRLLAVSAVLSLFYVFGGSSLLHGVAYGVIPLADKVREAGRFLYLSQFSAAVLCGYGMDVVFRRQDKTDGLEKMVRYLNLSLFALLLAAAAAFVGGVEVADSTYLSLVFAAGSAAILNARQSLTRMGAGTSIIVAFILCDLYAFYRPIKNHQEETAAGMNLLQRVVDAGALAEFFHAQPGVFRISIEDPLIRGIGDLYALDTVNAGAVTVDEPFYRVLTEVPRRLDLLNVRYTVTTRERPGKQAAFAESPWFVYEHSGPCERVWISRDITAVKSLEAANDWMRVPSFAPCVQATVRAEEPPVAASQIKTGDRIEFLSRSPGDYEVAVDAVADGLLVLSENYAPGWNVEVDGAPAELLQVDGTLQGVWLNQGSSRVIFTYRPTIVYVGMAVTAATFALIGFWAFAAWRRGVRAPIASG